MSRYSATIAADYLRRTPDAIGGQAGQEAAQTAEMIDDYIAHRAELLAEIALDDRAGSTEADELSAEQRRIAATALLRRLADNATDPGDRGYSLGIIDRIAAGMNVTPAYLEQLRAGLAAQAREQETTTR